MKTLLFDTTTCELNIYVWPRPFAGDLRTVYLTVRRRIGTQERCVIRFPVSEIPEIVKKLQECYVESYALDSRR